MTLLHVCVGTITIFITLIMNCLRTKYCMDDIVLRVIIKINLIVRARQYFQQQCPRL